MLHSKFKQVLSLFALASVFSAPCFADHGPVKNDPIEFDVAGARPNFPFKGVEAIAKSGNLVRYYTSDNSDAARPLVVMFPGSGCDGVFTLDKDGHVQGGLEVFAVKRLAEFRVVVLEPHGIPRQYASPNPGVGEGCPADYIQHENFNDTVAYYRSVLELMRQHHWLDDKKVMFVGISEGVVYSAEMARTTPEVSNLTLISAFGPDQLFGFMHTSLERQASADGKTGQNPQELIDAWQSILREPNSTTKFYLGHPYSRWATVAVQSPVDLALQSKADLFVAQGGQDVSAPVVGFEYGISKLILAKRRFVMAYIDCGDHHLICAKDNGAPIHLGATMQYSFDWFLGKKISGENITVVDGN